MESRETLFPCSRAIPFASSFAQDACMHGVRAVATGSLWMDGSRATDSQQPSKPASQAREGEITGSLHEEVSENTGKANDEEQEKTRHADRRRQRSLPPVEAQPREAKPGGGNCLQAPLASPQGHAHTAAHTTTTTANTISGPKWGAPWKAGLTHDACGLCLIRALRSPTTTSTTTTTAADGIVEDKHTHI
uniref:Uncharacterized protein n=1 Tax=Panagrellus redivivus TaxID=6233 RepID=A0A7E4ZXI2_PANRE